MALDYTGVLGPDFLAAVDRGGKVTAVYDVHKDGSYFLITVQHQGAHQIGLAHAMSVDAAVASIHGRVKGSGGRVALVEAATVGPNTDPFTLRIPDEPAPTPNRRAARKKPASQTEADAPSPASADGAATGQPPAPSAAQRTEAAGPQRAPAARQPDTAAGEPADLPPPDTATDELPTQHERAGPPPNPLESMAQRLEQEISGFFDNGQRASARLRQQLEDAMDRGDLHWGFAAAGVSGLEVLDLTMELAKGMPLGVLDIRNLGEGIQLGTFEGAKQDAQRLLNIVPQGRLLRLVDHGLTATDVVDKASSGDLKGAMYLAGFGALTTLAGGTASPIDTRIDPKKTAAYKRLTHGDVLESKPARAGSGSEWSEHEVKNNWGQRKEHYIGYLTDSRGLSTDMLQIDGLWASQDRRLILTESKYGNAPTEYSKHIWDVPGKVDQLKRYLQFMKENPNEISHVQLVVSSEQVAETFIAIMKTASLDALMKIDLIIRP